MKIVMLIDRDLPIGLIANTAAVLGITIGKLYGDIVGKDTYDADGNVHLGITEKVIPILRADRKQMRQIRERIVSEKMTDVTVVDFSKIARKSTDYESYTKLLAGTRHEDMDYLGLCLYGPVKTITSMTGSMALLNR